jgi:RNA polymerase sigma-70 factor (ECF subfamily)
MSGSHEIADEVTQDAFLFLLRQPGAYEASKGTLQSFLMGVARNLVRRSSRDATDDHSLDEDGIEDRITTPANLATPLDHAIGRQSAEALQSALLQLPQAYREAIILCDLQEVSYAEAAAILGVPIGTIRSRLHRGHIALLDQLSRTSAPAKSGANQ